MIIVIYYNCHYKATNCIVKILYFILDYLFSFRPSEFFRPPKRIPKFLLNDFTHNGKIPVEEIYKDGTKGKTILDLNFDFGLMAKVLTLYCFEWYSFYYILSVEIAFQDTYHALIE
jgi:hypothetical protein